MTNFERKAIGCRLSAVVWFVSVLVMGCGYGEVSPAAYQYAQALYGLSNRQASERIEEVAAKIAAAAAAGEVTSREAGWLGDICEKSRSGDWAGAQAAARRMMRDQVKG